MPMSKDRVEFTFGCMNRSHDSVQWTATKKAAAHALGISSCEFDKAAVSNQKIICRPSQFARFIIRRQEYGGQNQMAALEMKLIQAKEPDPILDVSDREA